MLVHMKSQSLFSGPHWPCKSTLTHDLWLPPTLTFLLPCGLPGYCHQRFPWCGEFLYQMHTYSSLSHLATLSPSLYHPQRLPSWSSSLQPQSPIHGSHCPTAPIWGLPAWFTPSFVCFIFFHVMVQQPYPEEETQEKLRGTKFSIPTSPKKRWHKMPMGPYGKDKYG